MMALVKGYELADFFAIWQPHYGILKQCDLGHAEVTSSKNGCNGSRSEVMFLRSFSNICMVCLYTVD